MAAKISLDTAAFAVEKALGIASAVERFDGFSNGLPTTRHYVDIEAAPQYTSIVVPCEIPQESLLFQFDRWMAWVSNH
jgi:hypothetical protein